MLDHTFQSKHTLRFSILYQAMQIKLVWFVHQAKRNTSQLHYLNDP